MWFDDGVNGVQQLSPDLPITAVLFANRSKVAESVSSLPDEMVELRHLNSALQSTLSDLEQRLAFMESRGAMISNSATDTGLADLGYVLYSESGAEPAPSAPRPTCPVCGKKRQCLQCHPLAGLGWQVLVRSTPLRVLSRIPPAGCGRRSALWTLRPHATIIFSMR